MQGIYKVKSVGLDLFVWHRSDMLYRKVNSDSSNLISQMSYIAFAYA
jgi:hypothetical protein